MLHNKTKKGQGEGERKRRKGERMQIFKNITHNQPGMNGVTEESGGVTPRTKETERQPVGSDHREKCNDRDFKEQLEGEEWTNQATHEKKQMKTKKGEQESAQRKTKMLQKMKCNQSILPGSAVNIVIMKTQYGFYIKMCQN